jgi:hypothetical protein
MMTAGHWQSYRPPEARMPVGLALLWATVDLPLMFCLRVTELSLEVAREWSRVRDA